MGTGGRKGERQAVQEETQKGTPNASTRIRLHQPGLDQSTHTAMSLRRTESGRFAQLGNALLRSRLEQLERNYDSSSLDH